MAALIGERMIDGRQAQDSPATVAPPYLLFFLCLACWIVESLEG